MQCACINCTRGYVLQFLGKDSDVNRSVSVHAVIGQLSSLGAITPAPYVAVLLQHARIVLAAKQNVLQKRELSTNSCMIIMRHALIQSVDTWVCPLGVREHARKVFGVTFVVLQKKASFSYRLVRICFQS